MRVFDAQGNPKGTNATVGDGFNIIAVPGTTAPASTTIVFSDSNGVSFGLNAGTMTASVAPGGGGGVGISAGTQSAGTGTVLFQNSHNISFGMSGSSRITGSASFPAQTIQPGIQSISGGTTRATTGEVIFANSHGISFGLDGQTITASVAAGGAPGSISAGTTRIALGEAVFSDSNGVSFGINGSTVTASVVPAGGDGFNRIAAGTETAGTLATVVFSNSNNVTFGMTDNSRVTASASFPAQTVQPGIQSVSAGTTRATTGEVVFSNSNRVSFGLAGQTITANIPGFNISAGTADAEFLGSSLIFANSNSISFGLNGQTMTASYSQSVQPLDTHNSAHHSGTIFPDGVNQDMGAAFLQIGQIAEPATPPTNKLRIYAVDDNGNTRLQYKTPDGTVVQVARDNILVVRNTQGSTINPGDVVYISGGVGASGTAEVKLAKADADTTMPAAAIVMETIANNGFGRVMAFGKVSGLNTAAFAEGARLFLSASTAGALTATAPAHPNLRQRIAIVINSHATQGVLLVAPAGVRGDHEGTNQNTWIIGDGADGAKAIVFRNTVSGHFQWNPTGNKTINLPDAAGTVALQSQLHTGSISAGTTRATLGEVVFSNSNNVSFGVNAQTVTASIPAQSVQPGIQSISGGTTRITTGEVVFSNSNNVTFGVNGQTLTGSIPAGATATGNVGGIAAGTQTGTAQTIVFSNSNNVTFGMSGSTRITASVLIPAPNDFAISAGTQSGSSATILFADSNQISFGMSNSTRVTATFAAIKSLSAGTTRATNGEVIFSNSNGVTFGMNAGTMTASVAAGGGGGPAISAGTQSVNTGTVIFSNSNQISFGMAGSQTLTGSFAAIKSLSAGTTNVTDGGISFLNGSGVTFGFNNNSLSASVAAAGRLSAGTTSQTLGQVIFSNSNNVTFGMNGGTITATAAGGAAVQPTRRWMEFYVRPAISNVTNITVVTNRPLFQPFYIEGGDLTISRANFEMSRSTSGSNDFTVRMGIYTYVNDTQISLLGSWSGNFSNTATASVSGVRRFALSGVPAAASTLPPGGYVFGIWFSQANSASMNYSIRGHLTAGPPLGAVLEGTDSYNTATSYNWFPFFGRFSTTTAVLPDSVGDSQVIGQFTGSSQPIGYWIGLNND